MSETPPPAAEAPTKTKEAEQAVATLAGIGASQAMIEFEMDGTIITEVQKAATKTGEQSSQVLEAASELSKQAEALSTEIDNFMNDD